ncbi:MAG: 4-phosphoerythronate dehydrogenase [Planctomycetota bacterium]|jgi:erythronate-4-phosphate dehydrogenase
MKILADENTPLAEQLFGRLGEVTLCPGRRIAADFPGLDEFEILLIRSVTEVNADLLERAPAVRIIATATIGTDHVDLGAVREVSRLRDTPIAVLSAPGCNAESVADYVWFALLHLTRDRGRSLSEMSLGIVGFGNCGSRVARRARGFGMAILRCDPPLAERDPRFTSDSLQEALRADFVTLHVPLTRPGQSRHPTHHMIGAAELAQMSSSAWLINSSRGGVVDSGELIGALRQGAIGGAVLDVYEDEPRPAAELIELPALATPHIAGYAVEAKRRGMIMVYEQTCQLLGVQPGETQEMLLGGFRAPRGVEVRFEQAPTCAASADEAARALLGEIYDIDATSRELKPSLGSERRGEVFDRMRRDYARDYGRHELAVYRVGFDGSVEPALRAEIERRLDGFGIETVQGEPHYVLRPC